MDNASVAEHQDCQRQKVGDDERDKRNALLHRITLVDAKRYAGSLHDIRRHCGESNLNGRDDDPDECHCSIDETLLDVQLQNAQFC